MTKPKILIEGKHYAISTTSGCWEWLMSKDKDGYGHLFFDKKLRVAHRISYIDNVGSIPQGLYICHSCDNRGCVNPAHLFVGSQKDNMRDRILKNGHRLISIGADVIEKIHLLRTTGMTHQAISDDLGVSRTHVTNVLNGKRRMYV